MTTPYTNKQANTMPKPGGSQPKRPRTGTISSVSSLSFFKMKAFQTLTPMLASRDVGPANDGAQQEVSVSYWGGEAEACQLVLVLI